MRRDQGEGRRQHLIQIHWMNLTSPTQPGKVTKRGPLSGIDTLAVREWIAGLVEQDLSPRGSATPIRCFRRSWRPEWRAAGSPQPGGPSAAAAHRPPRHALPDRPAGRGPGRRHRPAL
jgi:hypothetical protein